MFGGRHRCLKAGVHSALTGEHCAKSRMHVADAKRRSIPLTVYKKYAALLFWLTCRRKKHTETLAVALDIRLNGIAMKLNLVASMTCSWVRKNSCLPRPWSTAMVSRMTPPIPRSCILSIRDFVVRTGDETYD
jgi:hypothetical protein